MAVNSERAIDPMGRPNPWLVWLWTVAALCLFVLAVSAHRIVQATPSGMESQRVAANALRADLARLLSRAHAVRESMRFALKTAPRVWPRRMPAGGQELSTLKARLSYFEGVITLRPKLVNGITGSDSIIDILYSNLHYRSILLQEGVGTDLAQARAFFGLASNTGGLSFLTEADIEDAATAAETAPASEGQMFLVMGLTAVPRRESIRDAMMTILVSSPLEQIRVQALACLEEYEGDENVYALAQQLSNDPSLEVRSRARTILRRHAANANND